jgi:transposase-like protein
MLLRVTYQNQQIMCRIPPIGMTTFADERGEDFEPRRFPREIISYAVWLYYRFTMSFPDVEEATASLCMLVSYETVRRWSDKFGHLFAAGTVAAEK